ncbi:MAG: T9SS type A sorting domain-containing protein [Taibaiella sp.]|nr:T9SS type A sorting domain-containing protein [Taibaiella sp.]
MKILIYAVFMLGYAIPLSAQWTQEQSFLFRDYNVKHYTIDELPGKDQYLMAGTVFDDNTTGDASFIHFMYVDNAGNTIVSRAINDPAYDQRVVGAHYLDDNNALIVATHMHAMFPGNGDAIEVVRLDKSGNLLGATNIIYSTTVGYENIYPLSSYQWDDQFLFICGYVTPYGSHMPHLRSDKRAFVLKYDLISNQVINMRSYETGLWVGTNNDFDIASRMKRVRSGLWIGGSLNDGPMMNRIIDPVTLNDIYVGTMGRTMSDYNYESSFDIVEQPNGDFMVFGNTIYIDSVPGVFNAWHTPVEGSMHVTGMSPTLNIYPGKSRVLFNNTEKIWGINTLEGRDDYSIIISGMSNNRTCNGPLSTTPDNINPFLAEMRFNMSGSDIIVYPYYWNTVLSQSGTGYYNELGNPYSNLIHTPVNAVRSLQATGDIMLTAPVWNSYDSYVNFKWIRADKYGEVGSCLWAPACDFNYAYLTVSPGSTASVFPATANNIDHIFDIDDFGAEQVLDCAYYNKPAPTSIANAPQTITVSVSPNPASEYIHVQLPPGDATEGEVNIKISDITGRAIKVLYTGKGNNVPDQIALPTLASGNYLISIKYGSQKEEVVKLSIQ